ncbi:DUF3313 domain-containing protein [Methylocystis sp. MJC1]|jgi:hypothetical protein|uniref:DUF3313 domain-containing protein n=1 Tax=Methylocystis sp. MJC1 TaxID=2654282 RepID=UPI0013EDBFC0|nr:DUF3313 domain-containing protein [Methylocystis sp. MJC1]KAF2990141.1 hypothetical protein MJC1_02801 [Methylocystis sp. MJC1]MBU6527605.1 DUF3313 domain-containing protein [Methylocystis sp. MJC1]UZX10545.1 DUF3313 domain-containing protein [Methylocystis sp. MJC1]
MATTEIAHRLAIALLCLGAAACSSVEPIAYSGIASFAHMQPNRRNDAKRIPFRYATATDWKAYDRLTIDPVAIYRGADHQFADMSETDKVALADHMQRQFSEKLKSRFRLTEKAGPNTLRLRLTLTGAVKSTPVLSTLSRFDLAGGVYNGVQTVRGGEGLLTGSVIYAVEIRDSDNRLLTAFVTKQYPSPLNIPASVGSLSAAQAGIEKGAEALLEQLSGQEES